MNRHRRGAFACVVLLFTAAVGRVAWSTAGRVPAPYSFGCSSFLCWLPTLRRSETESSTGEGEDDHHLRDRHGSGRASAAPCDSAAARAGTDRRTERESRSAFDGTASAGVTSRTEEQLLEIFSSDTAEALMASSRDGGAFQLLGGL
jgi:hypothetical protein